MTLTEQRLCRMWAAAKTYEDWWDLWQRLVDISYVLQAECCNEATMLFVEASGIALGRAMYEIQTREAA
jgi:hypothetical protein